jgi:hypothetical protein
VRDQKRRFVLTPHQFYLPTVPSPLRGGEPWLSLFDPAELSDMLRNTGFLIVEDLGLAEITDRFYGALKQDIGIGAGPHVVRAQR